MVRTNQGGSILGFVIIGAVLAFLLIGGAYFVQHNLASVVDEAPVAVDDSTAQNPPAEQDTTDKDKQDEPATESENDAHEATQPAPTTPSEPVHDDTTHTDTHPTESGSSSTESLPQTGPGDMLIAGLLLSGAVGALAAYLRSRALPASL